MTQYSVFQSGTGSGTSGPGSSTSYSGPWVAGLYFKVTQPAQYLYGYYLWRADSSQSSSASFATWTVTAPGTGTVNAATEVSGSGFTTGAWNYVPLSSPYLLSTGNVYMAVYGYTAGNFPETKPYFETGGTLVGGYVNGPLTVYSGAASSGGTGAQPFGGTFYAQGSFSTAGANPATTLPNSDDSGPNFWIDFLIGPAPPPATVPLQQALKAKIPGPRLAGVYMGTGPNDLSFGTGQVQWNAGGPVRNPPAPLPYGPLPNFPVIIAVNSGWRNAGHSR